MGKNRIARLLPKLRALDEDAFEICMIAASYCWLPNKDVVRKIDGAVFPTIRARKGQRFHVEDGVLHDDNTTPRWAILWAHGIGYVGHPSKGWHFAHVWGEARCKDKASYTHIANIVAIRNCFSSLTDKDGPLVPYLKYHSFKKYNFLPPGEPSPTQPARYEEIHRKWRGQYFDFFDDPLGFVKSRLHENQNERTRKIRQLLV